jgi:hypothetical protein
METKRYDERQLTELLLRCGVPAFAWAVLFAFLAISSLVSRDEPKQMAEKALGLPVMAEKAAAPVLVLNALRASAPELRDVPVVAHEARDALGERHAAP